MTEKNMELLQLVPKSHEKSIHWQAIEQSKFSELIQKMKQIHQNPVWHGEDDVWTHTKMVCEELIKLKSYQNLERRKQQEVFLSALFHDIGKIPCTKLEDGIWISPNHTSVSARMVREFLWLEYGFCGTREQQEFRETICNIVRYHSVPMHILEQENPEYRLIKMASNGTLTPDFSIELLSILVEADMRGRICADKEQSIEIVEICRELALETGCFQTPILFPNAFSQYAYLSGRDIFPGQELYDDTWGEVILLSGLPGTGKDTWIKQYGENRPMISLDELRKQMKISPTEDQTAVANAAKEQAKEYLRKKQPFIWNATNITPMIRGKQIRLFENYKASVKIVFLETEWKEQMRRNKERADVVPQPAIEKMLRNLVLPERFEAHKVSWKCV